MEQPENFRVLVPVYNPLGGIKTYVLSYIRYLNESGYRFTILAPKGEVFDLMKQEAKDFPEIRFIDVPEGKSFRKMTLAIRRTLKTDSYLAIHSQGLKGGVLTAIANWGIRKPHVMTLHSLLVPQEDIPGKVKWLKKKLIGFVTRYIDEIIPVSQDCLQNHLDYFPGWKKGPCHVEPIFNGIDLDKFQCFSDNPLSYLRKKYELPPEMVLIGFFGRFMPEKGFLQLLDALKILVSRGYKDRIRLIAVRDDQGYLEYIRAVETNDTLRHMICLIDQQPNIAPLISQMNVVIMPSLWEACPLVPMEAMVLGVPVIGSDCLGLREVLRGTPSYVSRAGDPVSIADAVEEYINNPWDEAAKQFIPTARERFDVRNGVKKIEAVYAEWKKK
ncbi:MAG: glycosyltransferase family 4 protein [Planctomycetaceae bacterium]|jgi:glycosyltransferase involved in cell wall biosynthesis|nr:glycosyltransferase family 4 protein [Planctomycetaceae bacterium]